MNIHLFKALCDMALASAMIIAKILDVSTLFTDITVIFSSVLIVLAIINFIKYRKDKANGEENK